MGTGRAACGAVLLLDQECAARRFRYVYFSETKCLGSDSAETSLHADAYGCSTSDRIHNRDSARLIGGGQKKQRRGQVAYGHDHRALVDAAVLAGCPVYPDLFRLAENFADFGLGRLRLFDFAGIYFSTAGAGTNLQIDALRGAGRSG